MNPCIIPYALNLPFEQTVRTFCFNRVGAHLTYDYIWFVIEFLIDALIFAMMFDLSNGKSSADLCVDLWGSMWIYMCGAEIVEQELARTVENCRMHRREMNWREEEFLVMSRKSQGEPQSFIYEWSGIIDDISPAHCVRELWSSNCFEGRLCSGIALDSDG